jgi:hypothetical protein
VGAREERPSAAERLGPLLEWIRIDPEAEAERWEKTSRGEFVPKMRKGEVMRRLRTFVQSFNGHPLKVGKVTLRKRLDLDELDELALRLSGMLLHGGGGDLPSLSFQMRLTVDGPLLVVSGSLPDVVRYLAVRLVVDEQLDLNTCEAPEPRRPGRPADGHWRKWEMCGNLFVAKGAQRYCSETCKRRAKNPNWRSR